MLAIRITGNQLRAGRALADLSMEDLAASARLSRRILSKWESSSNAEHCSDRDCHSQRGRGMGAGQVLNSHRQAILEKICSTPRSVMVGNCLHPCWSALRWQNDTEYNALVRTHLSRSADVSATIGRDQLLILS
jgi:hypothetical protein